MGWVEYVENMNLLCFWIVQVAIMPPSLCECALNLVLNHLDCIDCATILCFKNTEEQKTLRQGTCT